MTYQEILDYMYGHLPMFHRVGKAAYKADLSNALALDELCHHPHKSYKTIHVAGTNGKGSISHMLASVLQSAGYKTGLFTSPHLKDFRERIRINGKMIPESKVIEFISLHKEAFTVIKPSFFEMTSAMAFDYFKKEQVDVAVIEVGMGGRLDSTNIITPVLSVITNIGFDHTEFLGDTLAKIASEKAGIIKPHIPVVVGESSTETNPVFLAKAFEKKASLSFADALYKAIPESSENKLIQQFEVTHLLSGKRFYLQTDLLGSYQQRNICTVLASLDEVSQLGFEIQKQHISSGIEQVMKSTGFAGRWQILQNNPTIICDTGHNAHGLQWVTSQLSHMPFEKLHFVLGAVNDKDIASMLELLPREAVYYFTKASIPRALDEKELQNKATQFGLHGKTYPNVKEALKNAKKNSRDNDLIFIGGSTFIVGEIM